MCCLFGVVDYGQSMTQKQMNKTVSVLAAACEARGDDATGIAYNGENTLSIFKRAMPAHLMRFNIPTDVSAVMGHTRLTTQGTEKNNYNNHPFFGKVPAMSFALAHNGVLHNDFELRKSEKLPMTNIATDSYIAVQLIEQQKVLNFESLKNMAEKLEGSFTITVLDHDNNLYFVKGDNPLCLYHFEKGFYIYASTEEILQKALKKMPYRFGKYKKINLACGEILKVDRFGQQSKAVFNTDKLFMYGYGYRYARWYEPKAPQKESVEKEYVDVLKNIASSMGYAKEYVDYLFEEGFSVDDVEEIIYSYC